VGVGVGVKGTDAGADVHHWQMPKIANYSQACAGPWKRDCGLGLV